MALGIFLSIRAKIMSGWLIALTGFVYSWVAIEQYMKGNVGLGIAYTGYAFANMGLYMLATK